MQWSVLTGLEIYLPWRHHIPTPYTWLNAWGILGERQPVTNVESGLMYLTYVIINFQIRLFHQVSRVGLVFQLWHSKEWKSNNLSGAGGLGADVANFPVPFFVTYLIIFSLNLFGNILFHNTSLWYSSAFWMFAYNSKGKRERWMSWRFFNK